MNLILLRPSRLQMLGVALASGATGALLRFVLAPLLATVFPVVSIFPTVLFAALIAGWQAGLGGGVVMAILSIMGISLGLSQGPMHGEWLTLAMTGTVFALVACAGAEAIRRLLTRAVATEERLQAALRIAGVGTWRYDPRTDAIEADDALVRLCRRTHETMPADLKAFLAIVDGRDRPALAQTIAQALEQARLAGAGDVEGAFQFRLQGDDGATLILDTRYTGVRDIAGNLDYVVGACLDVTERRRGEERNAHLAAIVSSSGDALISFDLQGRVISWNDAAESLFGYARDEIVGQDVLTLSADSARSALLGLMPRVIRGEVITFIGSRLRRDGSVFTAEVTAAPIRDTGGRTIAISALVRDITQRIAADQQKELLIRELHHRVRNTLATVQGLVSASARTTPPAELGDAIADRIQALARTHSILTENREQAAELRDVILLELAPYLEEGGARVKVEGPPVMLSSAIAVPLSMAVHELVTNATKHGALSVPTGRLDIGWEEFDRADGERVLSIDWRELNGPPVSPPARAGFGSTLLRRVLGTQLHATVDWNFDPEGVSLKILLPTGPRVPVAPASSVGTVQVG